MRVLPCLVLAALTAVVACSGADAPDEQDSDGSSGSSGSSGSGPSKDAPDASPLVPGQGDASAAIDGAPSVDGGPGGFTYKPAPAGCVTDVSAGEHTYSCSTLRVDATIPDLPKTCPAAGCGLILELHGDTGTGPAMDAQLMLRTRGAQRGYIVLAPTGPAIGTISNVAYPGSTWGPAQDANLLAIVQSFAAVFKVDPKRVHVTGFSRGGFTSWRFACDQSNLFASVAVGGAGNGATQLLGGAEATCFENGRMPARPLDVLLLMGRTDSQYARIVTARNSALATYGLAAGDQAVVKQSGTAFTQTRASKAGKPVVEWFDHAYEIDPTTPGLYAAGKGHCVPGSAVPKTAAYPVACKPPSGFDWGAEVLAFFDAHRKP